MDEGTIEVDPSGNTNSLVALEPISWVDGVLKDFPDSLRAELEDHFAAGGVQDFARDGRPTLQIDNPKSGQIVQFESSDGARIVLCGSRFVMGQEVQTITVVDLPGFMEPSIVCYAKGGFGYFLGDRRQNATQWKVWQPITKRNTTDEGGDPVPFVWRVSMKPKAKHDCDHCSHWVTERPSSPPLEPVLKDEGMSALEGSASLTRERWPFPTTVKQEDNTSAVVTSNDVIEILSPPSITSKPSRMQAERPPSQRHPWTPSTEAESDLGQRSSTSRDSPPTRRSTIEKRTFTTVFFHFLNDDDNTTVKIAPFLECSSASDLLDVAVENYITDYKTRVFEVRVGNTSPARMRVDKQEAYQEKVLRPLEELLRAAPGRAVTVTVKKYL